MKIEDKILELVAQDEDEDVGDLPEEEELGDEQEDEQEDEAEDEQEDEAEDEGGEDW